MTARQGPLATLLWSGMACRTAIPSAAQPSGDPPPEVVRDAWVDGPIADAGFGSAVATDGLTVWASAPHGDLGRVYRLGEGGIELVLEGEGRLGAALAAIPGGPLAGAPLASDGAGRVVGPDGAVMIEGGGSAGLAVWGGLAAGGGYDWVAATGTGWRAQDGSSGTAPDRPTDVASFEGAVAVGMARGPMALAVDALSLARPEPQDEAGFAVTVGDLDGDGTREWIVGAPVAGVVHRVSLDGTTILGTIRGDGGRFGAGLAVADFDGDGREDLVVGAPTSGDDCRGAAYLYAGGALDVPHRSWVGDSAQDQLGFDVASAPGLVVLGAPGGAGTTGRVRIVRP